MFRKSEEDASKDFYNKLFEGDFEFLETDKKPLNRTKTIRNCVVICVAFSLGYVTALFT